MGLFRIKKLSFSVFFTAYLAFSTIAFGGTIHAILVADTNDPAIGESCSLDLARMRKWAKFAAGYMDYTYAEQDFSGSNISRTAIVNAILNLQATSDDAVVFYYSGHGLDKAATDPDIWPNMKIDNGLRFSDIPPALWNCGAGTTLCIADACNEVETLPSTNPTYPMELHVGDFFRALLINTKQHIVISAAALGEVAWGDTVKGGLFTYSLVYNLGMAEGEFITNGTQPDWSTILSTTKQTVVTASQANGRATLQTPQYELLTPSQTANAEVTLTVTESSDTPEAPIELAIFGSDVLGVPRRERTVVVGQTLSIQTGLARGLDAPADIYAAIFLPNGAFLCLTGQNSFAPANTLCPLVSGAQVPALDWISLVQAPVTNDFPRGLYNIWIVATAPGASILDSTQWMQYYHTDFTVE